MATTVGPREIPVLVRENFRTMLADAVALLVLFLAGWGFTGNPFLAGVIAVVLWYPWSTLTPCWTMDGQKVDWAYSGYYYDRYLARWFEESESASQST